jgi:hypothetical protein
VRDLIKGILREESDSKKDAIKSLIKTSGIETASKMMGGIDNIVNIIYDGDIKKFSEDTTTPLVYASQDQMALYLHELIVNKLGLENANISTRQKTLGKFRYGTKNGIPYAFTANLSPTRLHDQPYYKVVGTSGDSGFGYAFINKRDTLGKRYRQQIFKQIIDKYDLEQYMKVQVFY